MRSGANADPNGLSVGCAALLHGLLAGQDSDGAEYYPHGMIPSHSHGPSENAHIDSMTARLLHNRCHHRRPDAVRRQWGRDVYRGRYRRGPDHQLGRRRVRHEVLSPIRKVLFPSGSLTQTHH